MSYTVPINSNPGKLTWEQIEKAAKELNVEPAALQAVYLTEASGNGYLPSGRPKILFEGHVFWKHLVKHKLDPKKYLPQNKDILYKTWVKTYYKTGEAEYTRLNRAIEIHEESALCSASYGAFQMLGENYSDLGYTTVQEFVTTLATSYDGQLKTLGQYLKFKKLIAPLQNKDWVAVAKGYNGPKYYLNKYDEVLAKHYRACIVALKTK
jgi:hypothetical protein